MLNNYLIINSNYIIEEYNQAFGLLMGWDQKQYIQTNVFQSDDLFKLTIFLDELKYKTVIKNYELKINSQEYLIDGVWIAQDKIFLIQIQKEMTNEQVV